MNVIWIVADTFRRDLLRCHGATNRITPNLDSFAATAVRFKNHFAGSFPTMPARADFMLGRWAFTFMGWEPLPRSLPTLAGILSDAGVTAVGVADTPFFTTDGFGYDRGFKYFYDLDAQRGPEGGHVVAKRLLPLPRISEHDHAAPRTMTMAERCLERIYDRPFFLYVDTWDPHEPFDPPVWYVRRFMTDYDGRVVSPPYSTLEEANMTAADVAVAQACYWGKAALVDRWIGRLLERVESLGIADDTAIIFTTDHGFHFGEHGLFGKLVRVQGAPRPEGQVVWYWKRSPLYRNLVHLPLLIRIPGVSPRDVTGLTAAPDIMPTVLELMDVAAPPGLGGGSLLAAIDSGRHRDFVVSGLPLTQVGDVTRVVDDRPREVAEYQPVTVTTEAWTLLYAAVDEQVELYSRGSDPEESSNVAQAHPGVVEELHARYVDFLRACGVEARLLEPRMRIRSDGPQ